MQTWTELAQPKGYTKEGFSPRPRRAGGVERGVESFWARKALDGSFELDEAVASLLVQSTPETHPVALRERHKGCGKEQNMYIVKNEAT